jgi:protein involved in polysaccharide export with SLBB domain
MKLNLRFTTLAIIAFAILGPNALPSVNARQSEKQEGQKTERPRKAGDANNAAPVDAGKKDQPHTSAQVPVKAEGSQVDDDAMVPYYKSHITSYLLGPEDVISIAVFGLDRYSKAGIVIPPDGRIDYYFIKEGLMVAGKTTRQVAEEITKHLDEYIIDPKVTVSLEKAVSQRYGVVGDVGKPGVFVLSRRLSVYEALNQAGGVLATGDKKRVVVLHWTPERIMKSVTIDIAAIEKGKAKDNYFLQPGDQVVVPGNKFKTVDKILSYLPIISFARIFTGGF